MAREDVWIGAGAFGSGLVGSMLWIRHKANKAQMEEWGPKEPTIRQPYKFKATNFMNPFTALGLASVIVGILATATVYSAAYALDVSSIKEFSEKMQKIKR